MENQIALLEMEIAIVGEDPHLALIDIAQLPEIVLLAGKNIIFGELMIVE
jgi:hypothetical protein